MMRKSLEANWESDQSLWVMSEYWRALEVIRAGGVEHWQGFPSPERERKERGVGRHFDLYNVHPATTRTWV